MTSSLTVLLLCILLASHGSGIMDNNQQIGEMMRNMMLEVEDRMETKWKADMKEKDLEIEDLRAKIEKGEMMREEKDNKVKKQLDVLETRNAELTTKIKEVDQKSLRDLPYILTCAYKDGWSTPGATITYDYLTADFNNSERPGGGDGDMNISTGVYTALTTGHYTVTYSGRGGMNPGEYVAFQLMHNNNYAGPEGFWDSYSASGNGGYISDQGSRTVVSVY